MNGGPDGEYERFYGHGISGRPSPAKERRREKDPAQRTGEKPEIDSAGARGRARSEAAGQPVDALRTPRPKQRQASRAADLGPTFASDGWRGPGARSGSIAQARFPDAHEGLRCHDGTDRHDTLTVSNRMLRDACRSDWSARSLQDPFAQLDRFVNAAALDGTGQACETRLAALALLSVLVVGWSRKASTGPGTVQHRDVTRQSGPASGGGASRARCDTDGNGCTWSCASGIEMIRRRARRAGRRTDSWYRPTGEPIVNPRRPGSVVAAVVARFASLRSRWLGPSTRSAALRSSPRRARGAHAGPRKRASGGTR